MSIENNLKRIAESLEKLVELQTEVKQVIADSPKQPAAPAQDATPPAPPAAEQKTEAAAATPETTPPAPPTIEEKAPPAPSAEQPAAPAAMTPQELNDALVAEFRRLGNREGIDKAMADLGVTSVNQLQPEQYQPLVDAVRAIQA